MSSRHTARIIALQTLFELDIREELSSNKEVIEGIVKRNKLEFGDEAKDISFALFLSCESLDRRTTIDDIISRAAPEWPLDKINTIDRNILRIGLCELLFGDRKEVPPKVAIDEAIELAKAFGGETSGKFVNGVLGAVYRELGEPDKDQKKEKKELKREDLVGAVVFIKKEAKINIALVHDIFGHWTLTKGHVDGTKDIKKETIKKIKEEIGLSTKIICSLCENEYIANKNGGDKIKKHVTYFLAEASDDKLKLEDKSGLDDVKWFPVSEIASLKIYDDVRPIISGAIEKIK